MTTSQPCNVGAMEGMEAFAEFDLRIVPVSRETFATGVTQHDYIVVERSTGRALPNHIDGRVVPRMTPGLVRGEAARWLRSIGADAFRDMIAQTKAEKVAQDGV